MPLGGFQRAFSNFMVIWADIFKKHGRFLSIFLVLRTRFSHFPLKLPEI